MQAISVRQPWAFAIARGGKTICNQDLPTAYRGPLLIHASMRVDLDSCSSPLIQEAGWDPADPLATLGAVIAVARLEDVCAAHLAQPRSGPPPEQACECGPWAEPGQFHWRLADIQALPRPVVALGRMEPWEPSPSLLTEVRTMLAPAAYNL